MTASLTKLNDSLSNSLSNNFNEFVRVNKIQRLQMIFPMNFLNFVQVTLKLKDCSVLLKLLLVHASWDAVLARHRHLWCASNKCLDGEKFWHLIGVWLGHSLFALCVHDIVIDQCFPSIFWFMVVIVTQCMTWHTIANGHS